MNREIQKNLFKSSLENSTFTEERKNTEATPAAPTKNISDEVRGLNDQLFRVTNQVSEQLKAQHLKFEKLAQALHRLELSHSGMVHETAEKMAHLSGKVAERKAVDYRIQELIDRQNTVLQTYELRLSNLQKVINEKEAMILSLKAYLNDARADIARLKR